MSNTKMLNQRINQTVKVYVLHKDHSQETSYRDMFSHHSLVCIICLSEGMILDWGNGTSET